MIWKDIMNEIFIGVAVCLFIAAILTICTIAIATDDDDFEFNEEE